MSTSKQIESVIRCAVETAIRDGVQMITGDWGLRWDVVENKWGFDLQYVPQKGTCASGACLLMLQPAAELKNGQPDEHSTLAKVLGVERFWVLSFLNGWDGEPAAWWDAEAFALGQKFASAYLPLEQVRSRAVATPVCA